jgi:hypothetical protein
MQVTMGRRTSVLLILTARKPEENKSGLKANLTVTVTDVRLSVNPGSEWRCDWTAVFTEHNGVGVTLTEMILGDTCTNPSIRRSADTAPMNIRIEAGQTTRSPFKMRVRDRRAGPDTHATAVRQYHGKDDNGNEVVVEYSVSK